MKTVESKENQLRSPELLNRKICVSNPGVWLLLGVMALLLVGICIWGIFGQIDSTTAADVRVENGTVLCYLPPEDVDAVEVGMPVIIEKTEGTIAALGEKGDKGRVCTVAIEPTPPDGVYVGQIVVKRVKPISFVLN